MTHTLSPDLNRIARLLDRSHPEVVVVVGAGVSINATRRAHSSWNGLLTHGLRFLAAENLITGAHGDRLESLLRASFSPFDLQAALKHAEAIEQVLNWADPADFVRWLEAAFADFHCLDDEIARAPLEALRELHEAGAVLLTTNYDSLLSDAIGCDPVTWEEHEDFLHAMKRRNGREGILHIHGHWKRPSSIVLGRASYDRVVNDKQFQQIFQALWLNNSWIYVGCGDGLDDPNLGRLLEWGRQFGAGAEQDYFLAREDKAREIASRSTKPPNLVSIGYPSHEQLPAVLRSVTPAARCAPFDRVDDEFMLFRAPFPSRREYLAGDVPARTADAELQQRFEAHGWACVMDVASVGKTTLALRAATTVEQRRHPVFYLDLKQELEDDGASPATVLGRLARPGTLLIIDNVHHQPELAHLLWKNWSAKPSGSRGRLLLVGTRLNQPVKTRPHDDLSFFEKDKANPAIVLSVTPDDLARVARHIHRRVRGASRPPLPDPPPDALAEWHRDYRASLNAFTFAVFTSLADFEKGRWALPLSRASAWVRNEWLVKLDDEELENTVCLAAFGAQELEILLPADSLPHPRKTRKLFRLGLVTETVPRRFEHFRHIGLREPGWGRLILEALDSPVDGEAIRFAAAARDPRIAVSLSSRLRLGGATEPFGRLWTQLAANPDPLVAQCLDFGLITFASLVNSAKASGQSELVARFWEVLDGQPDRFAENAWAMSFESLGWFLNLARQQSRNTAKWWEILERQPDKFAESAWATSLEKVGSFLSVAKQQKRNTDAWWDVLERQLDRFADSTWATSLEHVGSFLSVAGQQGRDTAPWWEILERQSDRFAEIAWSTSLEKTGSFLSVAGQQGRDTAPWWEILERQPDKFAESAWSTSLEKVGSFLSVAKQQGRNTAPWWEILERQSDRFADIAWATSLDKLRSFLGVAKQQGRNAAPWWTVLRSQPERLARKGLEASLNELVGFAHYAPVDLLEVAIREIRPGHWGDTPTTESLLGATWLAWHCGKLGRADLTSDLVELLLRRSNWRDFATQGGGFAQACWLLANVPSAADDRVDEFLQIVCAKKWLQMAFDDTRCDQLALGLRQLAVRQSVERCRHFHHPALGQRLAAEMAGFGRVEPRHRSHVMQLLGSAALCGWRVSRQILIGIKPESVAHLPVGDLPHRTGAGRVEDYQFQLWMGLRTFVSITRNPLTLPRTAIEETLRLWKGNLAESAAEPAAAAHRLDQSMIAWLEDCLRRSRPALVSSREPLWTVAGFPAWDGVG